MLLLRVELPNVPGSLGRLASAIGAAGGDIESIEIVEKRVDGTDVDDVLLDMVDGAMPDSVVSACNAVDGVRVLWISRYLAGGNLFLDLEVVESLTADPQDRPRPGGRGAAGRVPVRVGGPGRGHRERIRRSSWPARGRRPRSTSSRTRGSRGRRSATTWSRSPRSGMSGVVAIGRRGGPEFLDSELARLGHLVGLAASIAHAT